MENIKIYGIQRINRKNVNKKGSWDESWMVLQINPKNGKKKNLTSQDLLSKIERIEVRSGNVQ